MITRDNAHQWTALEERGHLAVRQDGSLDVLFEGVGRFGSPTLVRSVDRREAPGWSMSGVYGRDAFPWHTDGAISSHPPRWLALRPVEFSEPTTTELLEPDAKLRDRLKGTVLVARDHAGQARYLPALMPIKDGYRLRWDPRTCHSRSSEVARDIACAGPTAVFAWKPNVTLVIDNYKVLHRRPAVAVDAYRVLERTYVWSL
jgi:hypothetical protein